MVRFRVRVGFMVRIKLMVIRFNVRFTVRVRFSFRISIILGFREGLASE